ncbi:MAG: amino acid ABC transporter permease [Peptococcaceae bacterium]|nr:amino acid ABC transporter permease [Peptococcaceae bacterium]
MVGPFALFKWEALWRDWPVFAKGFGDTILASVLALVLALTLGIIFGVMGSAPWKIAKFINRIYVEVIQNTPLVIQVFFLFNGLPHLGIMMPVLSIGVVGVGVYHGAYIAEVVRAGIQSIHRGQIEAAFSQGFSFTEAMRYVILPQAARVVLPPLTNQAVSLVKNTSVLALIAGGDLMYYADSWSSDNLYYGPAYVTVAVLYLALCFPLASLARYLERRAGAAV